MLRLPSFIDRRHRVSQDQNPLNQMVLADLVDGTPEKRHLYAVDATDVGGIKTYKTVWTMGHKIRQALADRDAHYKLAGLIEMDDTYFGAPKPGKRGRGAAGKAKVVVAVETPKNKPRFAVMHMVPRVSGQEIQDLIRARLVDEVVVKTDGWQGYSSWILCPTAMSGSFPVRRKRRRRSCPGVNTLIANIKGNIVVSIMVSSPKHLPRYLARSVTASTGASENRKCLTVCFMLVQIPRALHSRS